MLRLITESRSLRNQKTSAKSWGFRILINKKVYKPLASINKNVYTDFKLNKQGGGGEAKRVS
jgi:hypothetical protein